MCTLVALKYCTYFKYVKYVTTCCRVAGVEDLQSVEDFKECHIVGMNFAYCQYFQ